ncbi:MAG TPA: hypothetical protein DCX06_07100 [Opitutae bacterium]|nr:hypothetical protein [Opitutae bacterium]
MEWPPKPLLILKKAIEPMKSADANEVTTARMKLGLTQDAFAHLLDTPLGTVQGWEQGRRKPPPCALLLMRVATKYPQRVLECCDAAVNLEVKSKAAETTPEKVVDPVGAQLHHEGDDTDFWLL